MLLEALRVFKDHPTIQLEIRGSNPNWPDDAKKEMRAAGLWLDFAPRSELDAWLQSADAFLIPMVFEEKYRRRMETSFPSKLIEFAQLGRPLIVWGPDYCSALKWAKCTGGALKVMDYDCKCVINAVEALLKSDEQYQAFEEKIQQLSGSFFSTQLIQSQFKQLIEETWA
jgi:glycosyltransferase involved in cell wall biosynthesis